MRNVEIKTASTNTIFTEVLVSDVWKCHTSLFITPSVHQLIARAASFDLPTLECHRKIFAVESHTQTMHRFWTMNQVGGTWFQIEGIGNFKVAKNWIVAYCFVNFLLRLVIVTFLPPVGKPNVALIGWYWRNICRPRVRIVNGSEASCEPSSKDSEQS